MWELQTGKLSNCGTHQVVKIIKTRGSIRYKSCSGNCAVRKSTPVLGHMTQLDPLAWSGEQHCVIADPAPTSQRMHADFAVRSRSQFSRTPGAHRVRRIAARLRRILCELQCGAGRTVDLAAMMSFHDLDVPLRRRALEHRLERPAQRHHAETEVRGSQDRYAFGRSSDLGFVRRFQSGGSRYQRRTARDAGTRRRNRPLRTAELDDDVALAEPRPHIRTPRPRIRVPRDAIGLVDSRLDTDVRSGVRRVLDRPTHATRRPNDDDGDHARGLPASAPVSMREARAASRITRSVALSTGTSGKRSALSQIRMADRRYFTGPGFDSTNSALNSGNRRRWTASASAIRPAR